MDDRITITEAYKAMYLYLENLQQLTGSDDLAGFLGSMSMLEDGKPVDETIWEDWLEAIDQAKKNVSINLKIDKLQ